MEAMSAPLRTAATNAITGVSSRAYAAATDATVPAIATFVAWHKHPHRRPRT